MRGMRARARRDHPAENYAALGKLLAACGDLYSNPIYGNGLIMVLSDGEPVQITKGSELASVIADRLRVRITKDGELKGTIIAAAHLNAMLRSKKFLDAFRPVDCVTKTPMYLADFTLTKPGYNDGGDGYRVYYTGGDPAISDSMETIKAFLRIMDWESDADRTNALAAALTVTLRNQWPGGKPIIVATATKSQAGKDTVIALASGTSGSVSISYQATNWALERSFVGAVKTNPDTGVVVIENARLDRGDRSIASAPYRGIWSL